ILPPGFTPAARAWVLFPDPARSARDSTTRRATRRTDKRRSIFDPLVREIAEVYAAVTLDSPSSAVRSVALRERVGRRERHELARADRVPLGEDRVALEEVLDGDRDGILAFEVGDGEDGILADRAVHVVGHLPRIRGVGRVTGADRQRAIPARQVPGHRVVRRVIQ